MTGQTQLEGGVKHDQSKRRMDLIPASLLNGVAQVLEFGAKKYGDNNWRQGLKWSRVYAALQRHLVDFWSGTDVDTESNLNHLYHAACNLAFLIEYYETKREMDDRHQVTVNNTSFMKSMEGVLSRKFEDSVRKRLGIEEFK